MARLTDEQVDRIARRVVDAVQRGGPTPAVSPPAASAPPPRPAPSGPMPAGCFASIDEAVASID